MNARPEPRFVRVGRQLDVDSMVGAVCAIVAVVLVLMAFAGWIN